MNNEESVDISILGRIIYNLIIELKWLVFLFAIFITILATHLHMNWTLLYKFTDSLKWPAVVLFAILVSRPYLPGAAKGIWSRLIKIPTPLGTIELSPGQHPQPQVDEIAENNVTDDVELLHMAATETRLPAQIPEIGNNNGSMVVSIQLQFERIYRQIYGTQMKAIQKLVPYESGLHEDEFKELLITHQELMRAYPPLSPYTSVVDLLTFPLSNGLLNHNPTTKVFSVTEAGKAFLDYLAVQNISINARPF